MSYPHPSLWLWASTLPKPLPPIHRSEIPQLGPLASNQKNTPDPQERPDKKKDKETQLKTHTEAPQFILPLIIRSIICFWFHGSKIKQSSSPISPINFDASMANVSPLLLPTLGLPPPDDRAPPKSPGRRSSPRGQKAPWRWRPRGSCGRRKGWNSPGVELMGCGR